MAYERDDLERAVLDVAERLLFRYGYKRLNLNDVAREARISKTTLYKAFEGKYEVAEAVVGRLLEAADGEMTALLEGEGELLEKLRAGTEALAAIYGKMDEVFLADLEGSLPELWGRIDSARRGKEGILAQLLAKEQERGTVRGDLDARLMASMILTVVREMYRPAYLLAHGVPASAVSELVMGILKSGIFIGVSERRGGEEL